MDLKDKDEVQASNDGEASHPKEIHQEGLEEPLKYIQDSQKRAVRPETSISKNHKIFEKINFLRTKIANKCNLRFNRSLSTSGDVSSSKKRTKSKKQPGSKSP